MTDVDVVNIVHAALWTHVLFCCTSTFHHCNTNSIPLLPSIMAFLARATARCVALSATSAATSSTRQLSKHVRACRMPSSATTTSASSSSSARTASSALPTQLTRATFGLTHCRWFSASLDLNVQHTPASSQGDSSGSGSSSSSGASLMDPELADVVGAADTVGLAGSQETVASGADGGMMEVSDAAARVGCAGRALLWWLPCQQLTEHEHTETGGYQSTQIK